MLFFESSLDYRADQCLRTDLTIRTIAYALSQASDRLRSFAFTAIARFRFYLAGVKVGTGFRATGWIRLRIHPTASVVFGRNCRVNSGGGRNLTGSGQLTGIFAGCGAALTIGDRVGISNSVFIVTESLLIGCDTLIGGGCLFTDSDLHVLPIPPWHHASSESQPKSRPIEIGSRVFVGAHSIVLKGVTIGDAAIVGAGSVVVQDVAASSLVASPAAIELRSLATSGALREPASHSIGGIQ